MDFAKTLIVFALTNFVIFFLGSLLPGNYLVFGNVNTSPIGAAIKTAVLTAVAVAVVTHVIKIYKVKLSGAAMMILFLLVNIGVLYFLARTSISELVGVGIVGFWVAAVTGFVVNLAQYATWSAFLADKKKK
jgi:hypothetical protein